jgi:hypothetical protein
MAEQQDRPLWEVMRRAYNDCLLPGDEPAYAAEIRALLLAEAERAEE